MTFDSKMLEFIVCPKCAGDLTYTQEEILLCVSCRLCFPTKDGIADLNIESAIPVDPEGHFIKVKDMVTFIIEKGLEEGDAFKLEKGACKAIGRNVQDQTQTKVFNVDFNLSLDDNSKKVITNYLNRTVKPTPATSKTEKKSRDINQFKRGQDLILQDPGVSRLHAMIFYDEHGIGILDLVSRNGTFVNGKEIEGIMLKVGDEIKIGNTVIRFQG